MLCCIDGCGGQGLRPNSGQPMAEFTLTAARCGCSRDAQSAECRQLRRRRCGRQKFRHMGCLADGRECSETASRCHGIDASVGMATSHSAHLDSVWPAISFLRIGGPTPRSLMLGRSKAPCHGTRTRSPWLQTIFRPIMKGRHTIRADFVDVQGTSRVRGATTTCAEMLMPCALARMYV